MTDTKHNLKAIVENGRTIRIIGKIIPSTPEEDRAEMNRVWTQHKKAKTRKTKKQPESFSAFGYPVSAMQKRK